MSKRFTDTTKWDHPWYQELDPRLKLAWDFICDKCDSIGVWRFNLSSLSFHIKGVPITRTEFEEAFNGRIQWLSDEKVWVESFIVFQYKKLNPKNKAHRGLMRKVIEATEGLPLRAESAQLIQKFKECLIEKVDPQLTLTRGSPESRQTLQDKDQDQEKEKDQLKKKEGCGEKTKIDRGKPGDLIPQLKGVEGAQEFFEESDQEGQRTMLKVYGEAFVIEQIPRAFVKWTNSPERRMRKKAIAYLSSWLENRKDNPRGPTGPSTDLDFAEICGKGAS